MERLEATDDFDGTPAKQHSKPHAKKGGNQKKAPSSSDGKKGYCMIHGEGNHTSEECYTLQKEAKKLKTSYGGKSEGKYTDKAKAGSGNKTWTRKADQGKAKPKSDLAAFIGKEIAKGMKKEKKSALAASKKRKNDSDDEEDLHVFDLEGFNYEDMDNLKIEEGEVKDEVSC